jgi:arylsulfatase A-like enzyme
MNYFKLFFTVSTVLFLTNCKPLSSKKEKKSTPNIVIIYADDMGYGDINCQNPSSKIKTPNLDNLAKDGMRFTDAHSASGVCSPSRYSLLTGRYHWRGHLKTGIIGVWGDPAIEEKRLTIGSMLQQKGYNTACIGKWHLGMVWPYKEGLGQKSADKKGWKSSNSGKANSFDWTQPIEKGPTTVGFDYYFGDGTINFPPYAWIENDKVTEIPTEILDLKGKNTAEGGWECRTGPAVKNWDIPNVPIELTEKSVAWIESQKGTKKPFFLYFPLPSPHAPIVPAKQFQGKSGAGGYGDYMMQTDWMVGQVLDALKKNGMDENTIVIFTSDNGPEKYAYDRVKNFEHKSMGDWRGLKRDLWEGGHRVPFIIKYPGVVPSNTISKELICQTDIFSTIADIVNFEIPKNNAEDSFSLIKAIKNPVLKTPIRNSVVHHSIRGEFALRKGDWVLIEKNSGGVTKVPLWYQKQTKSSKENTPLVLYNLKNDPKEEYNVYNANPEIVNEMKIILKGIKEKS